MKKYKTYWDNFNVELYALVRQVKKHNIVSPSVSSFQDAKGINLN